jgi:hypothetical protein
MALSSEFRGVGNYDSFAQACPDRRISLPLFRAMNQYILLLLLITTDICREAQAENRSVRA